MLSRLVTFIPIAALLAVVTAAPNALENRDSPGPICTNGDDYCCNRNFSSEILFNGSLGSAVTAVDNSNYDVVLTCNPVAVLGLTSAYQCSFQAACCISAAQDGEVDCAPPGVGM